MGQLNKLQFTLVDSQGNAISGVTITVMKQGATVNGTQSASPYTVFDPGAIATGDTVTIPGGLNRSVTGVTATTLTIGGGGLGTVNSLSRILLVLSLPTIYSDPQGSSVASNPLTTDASGKASCWIDESRVDVKYSKTGYSTVYEYDRGCEGGERLKSNLYPSGTAIAFRRDTSRALTANQKIESWSNNNSEKAYLDYAGALNLSAGITATTGTFSGAVTVATLASGAAAFSGAVTGTTANFSSTGIFGSTLTASSGFTMTAGTFSVPANTIGKTYTADGSADQNITAGAYATGNYVDVTSCTITFTPASTASEITIMAVNPMYGGGATYVHYAAIRDGSNNILAESSDLQNDGSALAPSEVTLIYRVTGLSGSQTFKVSVQCVTNNTTLKNSTNAATKRVTRIVATELKF